MKVHASSLKHRTEDYNKVLHVWDSAGIASLFCRELNRRGFESKALMRSIHDPFKMTKYYGQESLDLEGRPFLDYAKKLAVNYGIIHIHGIFEIVPEYKKSFPNKKIVLHFHGSNLTNAKDIDELVRCAKQADKILCATPDLVKILDKQNVESELLLNPIDTELFEPMPDVPKSNKAVYVKIRYIEMDKVEEFIKKHCNWEYEIYDRDHNTEDPEEWKNIGRPFYKMPEFYNRYERLIDVKIYSWLNGKPAHAYSKTGLEALACGLEILNHHGDIIRGLPKEHTPKYAVNQLIGVYDKL
jgi:hypothetical protein